MKSFPLLLSSSSFSASNHLNVTSGVNYRLKKQSSSHAVAAATTNTDEHDGITTSAAAGAGDNEKFEPINPQVLFLIRLLFLFYFGSMGAILPYLSVYYHSIGHGGPIIGLLSAISPLTTFLVGPLWGIVSDQSSNPVVVLQIALVVSVVGKVLVATHDDATYVATMVFVTALFSAPIKSLMDAMILSRIPDRSLYGRLRMFGQVGFSLGTFLMGYLLTARENGVCSKPVGMCYSFCSFWWAHLPASIQAIVSDELIWFEHHMKGYRPIFFVHAALAFPAWIIIRVLDRMEKKMESKKLEDQNNNDDCEKLETLSAAPTTTTTKDTRTTNFCQGLSQLLAQNPNARLFFILVFVAGLNAGVNETFGNVRIRELGGTPQQMGFFRLLGAAGGAPMFWFSSVTTQYLGGTDQVILMFLAIYMARFAALAFMTDASYAMPGECLRGAAYAAFMSSATVYAHKIAPEGMNATLLMLVNGLYAGLGQSLGAVVSGKLQQLFGTAKTFFYVAVFDLVLIGLAILYLFVGRESRLSSNTNDPEEKIKKTRH